MMAAATRVATEGVLERLMTGTHARPVPLGRYDVVGRLGAGGMGTVYDAVDRERGTRVALKTLSAADMLLGVNLKREFRAVADLSHPNLAAVYELGCEDGLWFFAMEHIDGVHFTHWARESTEVIAETVQAPIARVLESGEATVDLDAKTTHDPFLYDDSMARSEAPASAPTRDLDSIRRAFADLVRGLCALHQAGLWHGDIKGSNVLVRPDGRVVIVDFGLARSVNERRNGRGPMPGTPIFMSPEQLSGEAAGPPSDWHALGCLLYEVLTGTPPYVGGSLLEIYFRKSLEVPPSPRELVPELPEDLSDVCMALLRPEPERRPKASELLRVFAGDEKLAHVVEHARSSFVGRQRELAVLEHAYGRTRRGHRTVVHVRGPSGIGKTTMLRRFLAGVHNVDQAFVFRGRCYERESVPYKAFDGIVDDLTSLFCGLPPGQAEQLVPEWVGELCRVFPALLATPALAQRNERATVTNDARELRRRAWRALGSVFEALGRYRPVVLSIDDLQWADADSIGLLDALIDRESTARILLVSSFRPQEASRNAALSRHLERPSRYIDIELTALPGGDAQKLARSALESMHVPPTAERVQQLANEAQGVPFFIEELARFAARHDGELRDVSLEKAIAARVRALPAEQRSLMEVVAIADAPVPQSVAFRAASLDAGALPALLALRSASLLGWMGASGDDLVSTYHDRIRESVLAAMDEDARALRHLSLGRALVRRHLHDGPGPWVFAAVRHLDASGRHLSDAQERRKAAELHLQAGRLARSSAAFPLASRCFEGGIALLAADAWTHDYDLALGLFSGAAEAAYLTADMPTFEAHVATVKAKSKSVLDQLPVWELEIDARIGRHDYDAAIDGACEALSLLSVDLPRNPDRAAVETAFTRALASLNRVGPAGLEALPDVTDPETAAAMRLQIRVSPAAYFGRPLLLPVIASNLVATSVERGLSSATPYALALFGIVMNTLSMYPEAHRWGQLAVRLIDRFPDQRLEAATRHLVFNLVCTWMVPLHTVLGPLREVFDIGRKSGDYEYASYAAHGYSHHALYAGRPLKPLLAEALALGAQMRAFGQVNAVHVHAPFEQLLKALTGELRDPSRLDDAGFDEERELARAKAEGSRSGIFIVRLVMGLARFAFGRFAEARECLGVARAYADAAPSVWHFPIMHQFGALACCAVWDVTDESERPALRETIDAGLSALRVLAGHAPVNFAHRVLLIEAELARIEGQTEAALAKLDEAVARAGEAGFISDIALAHELRAKCQPDEAHARAALLAARDAYAEWGADAKVKELGRQLDVLGK